MFSSVGLGLGLGWDWGLVSFFAVVVVVVFGLRGWMGLDWLDGMGVIDWMGGRGGMVDGD